MLFSVIVPIYGVEKYIHKCVDSILGQSFTDFELILVDDGSKDNCPRICDEYAEKDSRVRVIHKPNGRLVSARNTGIAAAQGKYICYVDGDDWVAENWLTVIKAQIDNSPCEPDLVAFGAVRVFADSEQKIIKTVADGFYDKERLEKEVYPVLLSNRSYYVGKECIYPAAWNKAYKRELLTAHHCTDEKITRSEDAAFTFECFLYANSAAICDDVIYYYNKTNENSMLTRYDSNRVKAYARYMGYLNDHILGLYDVVDAQINDLYANYIAMLLVHELGHHPSVFTAARNIRRQFGETGIMRYVKAAGLPFSARVVIVLLKMRLYLLAVTGCKLHMKMK